MKGPEIYFAHVSVLCIPRLLKCSWYPSELFICRHTIFGLKFVFLWNEKGQTFGKLKKKKTLPFVSITTSIW